MVRFSSLTWTVVTEYLLFVTIHPAIRLGFVIFSVFVLYNPVKENLLKKFKFYLLLIV